MSSPETNIETQSRRHRGPLVGMAVAVGFAAVAFLIWIAYVAADGNNPSDATVVNEEEVAPGVVVEERATGADAEVEATNDSGAPAETAPSAD